jgi:hypothetical protein
MERSAFELGKLRGELRGQQMARVEFYEKRLGRSLTDVERATLINRIDALGFARVDDVILGLSSDALAAWLHDPDAT